MPRNFQRRVEVMFPIVDPDLRKRLLDEVLGLALRDNVKARRLQTNGTDAVPETGEQRIRSQGELLQSARQASQTVRIEPVIRHNAAP